MSRFSTSSGSHSVLSSIDLEPSELAFPSTPSTVHIKSEKHGTWPGSQDSEKNQQYSVEQVRRIRHFSIQPPPADRGYRAWGYLLGAFIVEALCWGTKHHSY